MAIGAPNFAFVDLGDDHLHRPTCLREMRNVMQLVAQMIELEYMRIGLAAVDARMRCQVLPQKVTVDLLLTPLIRMYSSDLARAIGDVVRAIESGETLSAP